MLFAAILLLVDDRANELAAGRNHARTHIGKQILIVLNMHE